MGEDSALNPQGVGVLCRSEGIVGYEDNRVDGAWLTVDDGGSVSYFILFLRGEILEVPIC